MTGNTGGSEGGGIYSGSVTLTAGSSVSSNEAKYGGGIFTISGSTLMVQSGTLSGNSASASGGGVYNSGTMTVGDSTLSGNSAADGGGVCNTGGSTLTIVDSKLTANTATTYGGGIYSLADAGAVELSGNSAYVTDQTANGGSNSGGSNCIYSGTLSGVTTRVSGNRPDDIYETT